MIDECDVLQIDSNHLYAFFNQETQQYDIRYARPEEVGGFLVVRSYLYDLQNGMQMFNQ